MKYRICKNGNDKYKIRYKRRWTLWWFDLEDLSYKSRKWKVVLFDTIEEAEKRVLKEKKCNVLKRERHEKETRNNIWSCMGEY